MSSHVEQNYSRTVFGFWLYLMTDCILFGTLFAAYALLRKGTYGGPGAGDVFSLPFVLGETMLLLTSTFTCGLAMIAAHRNQIKKTVVLFAITFFLGAGFLAMEIFEFAELVLHGNGPTKSAFFSSFFTLVGTHGLHIVGGLLWIIVLLVPIMRHGITPVSLRRLTCLSLFWHFLDVVWIFIFSFVYLIGAN